MLFAVPAPVVASHSWYLGDLDPGRLAKLGAADEKQMQRAHLLRAVVVLDAGDPDVSPGSTQLPDRRGPASAAAITKAASSYALGWTSVTDSPQLILVVATSNSGSHVDAAHGAAWGRLADAVQDADPQADVRGGLDDEQDYGPPAPTLAWLQAYSAATLRPFVDLGDCSCTVNQALPNGWTLAERAQVALTGSVLPQQYRTTGIDAKRWANLYASTGRHLLILGALTETRACIGPPMRACDGIDQTPAAANKSLKAALNQSVPLATDIGYLVPPAPAPAKSHALALVLGGSALALLVVLGFALRRRKPVRRHY